jgi:hypothetical protein
MKQCFAWLWIEVKLFISLNQIEICFTHPKLGGRQIPNFVIFFSKIAPHTLYLIIIKK